MKGLRISKITLFIIITTIVLSVFTFRDSFSLALPGDDWLLHYTIWTIFDVQKSQNYFDPTTYLCTYCPHYLFLSLIKYFWGISPFHHYLVSLLIRIGIAISLFFLVKNLTKQVLPAALAAIFFSVNYIGIQTTDWVFNFTHYMGVIAVAIFIFLYFKAKSSGKLVYLLYISTAFAAALIISPPRMHGLFPLVLLIELGSWIIEGKKYNLKHAALRVFTILLTYKLVFSNPGYGTTEYNLSQVSKGLELAKTMLSSGNFAFLLNPISSVGNFVIPGPFWQKLNLTNTLNLIPIATIFTALSVSLLYLANFKRKAIWTFGATLFVYFLIIAFVRKLNLNYYSIEQVGYALIGGYTILLSLWLFFGLKKDRPLLAYAILVGQGWMFTFNLFPWLIAPYLIIESNIDSIFSRYSVQQSAGLSVWMATIFTIAFLGLREKRLYKFEGILYFLILAFIIMHTSFSQQYLSFVKANRNIELDNKLWSKIFQDVPELPQDRPSIFFLTFDNYHIAEDVLRFGFSSRAALHYSITNQKANPFMIYEYNKLLSMVTDGKALEPQGYEPDPLPLDYVYGYVLQNEELKNITDQLRAKLKEDVSAWHKENPQPLP